MTVGDEYACDQPNQSFERHRQSASFSYQMHCLVCKGELNFDIAEKKPDAAKYLITEVSTIIRETRKCKLHEMLKKVVAERIDLLAVELAAKLSYTSCICAEVEKYYRDCMQRFLSGVTVIQGPIKYNHFVSSKNDELNNFCDW